MVRLFSPSGRAVMTAPDLLKTVVPDPGEVARIVVQVAREEVLPGFRHPPAGALKADGSLVRSEEHTSELQSH